MLTSLLNVMFGCSHKRTTFPITLRSQTSAGGTRKGAYVVCLECGREFPYNWNEMRVDHLVSAPVQPSLNHQIN
jgi:hypothetical protein